MAILSCYPALFHLINIGHPPIGYKYSIGNLINVGGRKFVPNERQIHETLLPWEFGLFYFLLKGQAASILREVFSSTIGSSFLSTKVRKAFRFFDSGNKRP